MKTKKKKYKKIQQNRKKNLKGKKLIRYIETNKKQNHYKKIDRGKKIINIKKKIYK